jgi:hypothetical protein
MGVDGEHHAPAALYPGKFPVPIVSEAGWAPWPVWTGVENLTPPPGFDARTVQPVASRYTKYLYVKNVVVARVATWRASSWTSPA